MVNKRNVSIIILFAVLTLVVLLTALSVHRKGETSRDYLDVETIEQTQFKQIHYFSTTDAQPDMTFQARMLDIQGSGGGEELYFVEPVGKFKMEDEWMDYGSKEGNYQGKSKELKLTGDVKIKGEDATHESDTLYFNGIKKFLEAKGEVKSFMKDKKTLDVLNISSNYINSWVDEKRTLFMGNVVGALKRKRRYEGGLDFHSEKLELNQLKSLVTLSNNVKLDRNNYHLEAQKAEIFLQNFNKKLKYYVLYDDIKLVEKLKLAKGKTQIRRAYSEKLEGYISEGKIVLSGAPRVEQGEDIIKGYQITLRENVEIVEVDDSQSSFNLKKDK
jgi:lipopolysaccharide transport protein LptA